METSLLFRALLYLLPWIGPTLSMGLRKRNGRCDHRTEHFHSYGRMASGANASHHHHLSLILPSIGSPDELRRIPPHQLPEEPMLSGHMGCPTQPNTFLADPVMHRSICPWYWKVSYDARRIPAVLPQAVCRCERAVTGDSSALFLCQPISIQIKILKFDQNCDEYREETLNLAVACVSVMQVAQKVPKMDGVETVQSDGPVMET